MYVAHLSLHDFRSYATAEVALEPGVTSFIGRNGQGKTNLVEAIDYLSRLTSHRVATDAPLVRHGAEQAVVRAAVVKEGRTAVLEVELNPGRANRARVNKSALPRTRDLVGLVRTVIFSPEDLTLVKGDPSDRRRFLDDLVVLRTPRLAGTRADYDRVLKQRNSLLKTAGLARGSARDAALGTLAVWDEQLARHGAELLEARLALVDDLRPYVGKAYETVARGASRDDAEIEYKSSVPLDRPLDAAILAELERRRKDELDRGISLVGPHRDELLLWLGHGAEDRDLPAAGEGLRLARRVLVVRAGAPAGVVRPAAVGRRRPDPDPRRRLRRARQRTPRAAGRPGRRRRAGARDRGGAGGRAGRAARGAVRRRGRAR